MRNNLVLITTLLHCCYLEMFSKYGQQYFFHFLPKTIKFKTLIKTFCTWNGLFIIFHQVFSSYIELFILLISPNLLYMSDFIYIQHTQLLFPFCRSRHYHEYNPSIITPTDLLVHLNINTDIFEFACHIQYLILEVVLFFHIKKCSRITHFQKNYPIFYHSSIPFTISYISLNNT